MRKGLFVVFAGASAGLLGWLWLNRSRERVPNINVKTSDLDYPDRSPEELSSAHLIDLNEARPAEFVAFNLSPEALDRLIENRPYRSKLELLSRMVLTEPEYEVIKDKVGVAESREPVKIAS